jgi:hypothetical protein
MGGHIDGVYENADGLTMPFFLNAPITKGLSL